MPSQNVCAVKSFSRIERDILSQEQLGFGTYTGACSLYVAFRVILPSAYTSSNATGSGGHMSNSGIRGFGK